MKKESVFPSRTILRHSKSNRIGRLLRLEDRSEHVSVALCLSFPDGGSCFLALGTDSLELQLCLDELHAPAGPSLVSIRPSPITTRAEAGGSVLYYIRARSWTFSLFIHGS